jgi:5-methylcytosine-specific restriction protein A
MPTIYKPKKKKNNNGNQYDKERRKVYSSERWRTVRRLKFQQNPLCEKCEEKGLTVQAEDIHHVISFMSTNNPDIRYNLAYDFENLLSLCKQCHQKIHSMQRNGIG